jgi:tRNA uridine 5-carboxymethylaminomethyl modification enzyme
MTTRSTSRAARAAHHPVIVIGGGHAGVEAARAAADALRARGLAESVALVTLDHGKTGVMSCNPAVGGIAKGQMVRELDALGGIMPVATDRTGIMFKRLNTSKGAAVRSPRAQCDRHAYARVVRAMVDGHPGIRVYEAAAESFVIEESGGKRRVRGVSLAARSKAQREAGVDGLTLTADAVVLTTGTFMRGLMHTGGDKTEGGRAGEAPAVGMSRTLLGLGFELGRLKTGTPPRLKRGSIAWDDLEPQFGDDPPVPFSDLSQTRAAGGEWTPELDQVPCRITSTNGRAHAVIRDNLHRAPMFSGQIESIGPRYCPSIEDKVVRFADRDAHHVFLEPESHESDWVYCNGIATSLPADVQEQIVHAMPGCERAEIVQFGYAVEYDMVRPHQINATTEAKHISGLYLAGQINGTSGYEEAAGQGVLAGVNAARRALGDDPVTLARDAAYIGVMMDDLVTKTPVEPYRMFTSRAEYRLLLRADNTADRLTPLGRELGLVDDERWAAFERRREALESVSAAVDAARIDGHELTRLIRRPEYTLRDLRSHLGAAAAGVCSGVLETVLAERKYHGYIARQHAEIRRHEAMERRRIPASFEPSAVPGLRSEARQALERFRPETFGQASRLEGIKPADITLLVVALDRARRGGAA